jgi:hypothetical protein
VKYMLTGRKGHEIVNDKGERVIVNPGEVCELSDDQYKSFRDRFKPLAVVEAEAKVAQAVAEAATASVKKADAPNPAGADASISPEVKTPATPTQATTSSGPAAQK